jgi:hypothetical protein
MLQPDLATQCGHQLKGGVANSSTLSSLQHMVQPPQCLPKTASVRCVIGQSPLRR